MPQFHVKALGIRGNEEPRREGQYRGSRSKNAVFIIEGRTHLYMKINRNKIYHPTLYILSGDGMIYTNANMYIAFLTPVMDDRDRGQV